MINEFQMKMDAICNNILPPLLYNGMLTIAGRDTSVITHLDSFNLDATENYQPQNATMSNHLMQLQQMEAFHEPFEGAFPEAAEGYEEGAATNANLNNYGAQTTTAPQYNVQQTPQYNVQ